MKFDTININQIYHTSHCGSTLMAALLSNSSIVYSEPPWTKNLLLNEDLDFNLLKDLYNIVIKFGSGWCKYSNIVPGKKIFLYRKLKHHMFKIKTTHYFNDIVTEKYEYHLKNCHPSLKGFEFETDFEKIAFMWLNNVQWIREVDDVLWIETNDFLKNKKQTMNLVCDHFQIDKIKNYELSTIHVKTALHLNGRDTSINETPFPISGMNKTLYSSFGVIDDDLCDQYPEIEDLICQVKEEFVDIDENILK